MDARNEVIQEMIEFMELIDSIEKDMFKTIKSKIEKLHTTGSKYDPSDHEYKQVPNTVKSIKLSIRLNYTKSFKLKNSKIKESYSYDLSNAINTDLGGIIDGQVSLIIWKYLKDKIDLSKFSNFKPPEFR